VPQGNTTRNSNTADGYSALVYVTTGHDNIGLGQSAGTKLITGSNNIDIGNTGAKATESGIIRIGTDRTHRSAYIAGVSGVTGADGVAVVVDTQGHLGTLTSSARYKDAIKPMDKASEALLALQPVTFRWRDLDPTGIPQFGLVAEQVGKVDPDLVARDDQGKPYTVRYEAVNAMLLNEFLKEHRKVEVQECKIETLEATVAKLQAALEKHAAQIQKVSDQLRTQALDPRVVSNN
jgi:hypothetical protein